MQKVCCSLLLGRSRGCAGTAIASTGEAVIQTYQSSTPAHLQENTYQVPQHSERLLRDRSDDVSRTSAPSRHLRALINVLYLKVQLMSAQRGSFCTLPQCRNSTALFYTSAAAFAGDAANGVAACCRRRELSPASWPPQTSQRVQQSCQALVTPSPLRQTLFMCPPHICFRPAHQTVLLALRCPLRAYTTSEKRATSDASGSSSPTAATDGARRAAESTPASFLPTHTTASRRFSHRRSLAENEKQAARDDAHTKKQRRTSKHSSASLQQQQQSMVNDEASKTAPPLSSSSHGGKHQCGGSSPSKFGTDTSSTTTATAAPRPRFLRDGQNTQTKKRKGAHRGDDDVVTQWGDAPTRQSGERDRPAPSPERAGHIRAHGDAGGTERINQSEKHQRSSPKRRKFEESLETSAQPASSATANSSESKTTAAFTNADKQDGKALRTLLQNHKKFLQNFTTLKQSEDVAAALQRLCAEALAHSGLIEALAEAFTEQDGTRHCASCDKAESQNATLSPSSAPLPSTGHLVLTYVQETAGPTLAILTVPQRVVQWLNTPIELPLISMADVATTVEKELAHVASMETRTGSVPLLLKSGKNGEAGADISTGDFADYGPLLWYVRWGQLGRPSSSDAASMNASKTLSSTASDHSAAQTPSAAELEECMVQWHERHVGVAEALLPRFQQATRPVPVEGRRHAASARHSTQKTSAAADWRSLPCTAEPHPARLHPESKDSRAKTAPVRPDQTVADEMRVLLDALKELLDTLIAFKTAQEETRLQPAADTLTLKHSRGGNSLQPERQTSGDVVSASVENGNAARQFGVDPADAFAQVRQALLHLEQVEAAHANTSSAGFGEQPSPADATIVAAQEQVKRASAQYLSFTSCVDVVQDERAPPSVSIQSTENAVATAPSLLSAFTNTSPVENDASLSAIQDTPTYTAAALDMLIGVLLRCLLFYMPALRSLPRLHLLQRFLEPWVTTEQSVPASHWAALFGMTDMIVASGVVSECANSPERAADNAARSAVFHNVLVTKTVVRMLRLMCWPTVFDYRSSVVQRLFDLLHLTVLAADAPPSDGSHQAEPRNGGAQASLPTAASLPAWCDVVCVLKSNEERQCAAYEVLVFFMTTAAQLEIFNPSLLKSKYHYDEKSGGEGSRTQPGANGPSDSNEKDTSSSSSWNPRLLRNIAATFFYLLDIDRFITEHVYRKRGRDGVDVCALSLSNLLSHPLPPPLMRACAQQISISYGLTRVTLSALHEPLLIVWSTMSRVRRQAQWDAFRYAVVTPAATAQKTTQSFSGLPQGAEQVASAAPVTESAVWQVCAPVLLRLSANVPTATWKLMWSFLEEELASFPGQMRNMMQPSEDKKQGDNPSGLPLAEKSGSSRVGTEAETRERDMEKAVCACCTELGELTLMCAWLLVAAQHAFSGLPTLSAGSAVTEVSARSEAEKGIERGFAACVKGVLAIWTDTGIPASAAQRVFQLFPLCCTSESASTSAAAATGRVSDALLSRLAHLSRRFLWTTELEHLVRDWEAKTRFVQQDVPSLAAAISSLKKGGCNGAEAQHSGAAAANAAAHTLEGLVDVDPCILGWWRSLQAEDVGLPSAHVYLLQVFVGLRRIMTTRGGTTGQREARLGESSGALTCLVASPPQHPARGAVVKQENGNGAAAQDGSSAEEIRDGSSDAENGADTSDAEVSVKVPGTGTAMFSAAELIVVLRLLASISMRGGLPSDSLQYDGMAGGNSESGVAASGMSIATGSIWEALSRVALHSIAQATAASATASKPAPSNTLGNEASNTRAPPSKTSSTLDEQRGRTVSATSANAAAQAANAVREIELALLYSVHHHASALPAASLLDAVWLGLYPLSELPNALRFSPNSAEGEKIAGQATAAVDDVKGAAAVGLPNTLRALHSPLLDSLHQSIRASPHVRLLCCFVMYRNPRVLQMSDEVGSGGEADVTNQTKGGPTYAAANSSKGHEPTRQQLLVDLFARIRASCVEAFVQIFADAEHAPAEVNGSVASRYGETEEKSRSPLHMGSPNLAAVGAARPSRTSTSESEGPVAQLKDHARQFLQVYVLSSELHHRLCICEAHREERLTSVWREAAMPAAEYDEEAEKQRLIVQLYAALLAATRAYVRFSERGYSTVVVQLMSIITWRMRKLGVLPLENVSSAVDTGVAGRLSSPAAETSQCDPSSGPLLLGQYRDLIENLMPQVDAEARRMTGGRPPSLLKLTAMVIAKAATEQALQGIPRLNKVTAELTSGTQARALTSVASKDGVTVASGGSAHEVTEGVVGATSHGGIQLPTSQHPREGSSPTSARPSMATSSLAVKPFWTQVAFESLLHRVAAERRLVLRHEDALCAVAVVAPELAGALLPAFNLFCAHSLARSAEDAELKLIALVACATAWQRQNQREMDSRDGVSLLSTVLLSGNAGTSRSDAVGRGQGSRRVSTHDGGDLVGRGDLPAFALPSSTLRVGEISVMDASSSDPLRRSQSCIPVYRSPGSLSTSRPAPSQLRRLWMALVQGILENDSGGTDSARSSDCQLSLWVTALHCGAAIGVVETQLFEQLLACLVFNPVAAEDGQGRCIHSPEAPQLEGSPRVARLNATEWTLVVEACAAASDHHYREGYRAVLREDLIAFLCKLHLNGVYERCKRSAVHLADTLASAGPAFCGLLEALPTLFLDDMDFWDFAVKAAVVRCCDEVLKPAGDGESGSTAADKTQVPTTAWANEWKRSFNWAVRCAGHPSLVLPDTWTDPTAQLQEREISNTLEERLREMQHTPPAARAKEAIVANKMERKTAHEHHSVYVTLR